jgi:hypothetical protein
MNSGFAATKVNKQLYKLCLDDYSAASFTSFSKDYYGTLDEIAAFINSIRDDGELADKYTELIACFDRYMGGKKDVVHNVAYKEVPFLVRVKRLGTAESVLRNHKWEHVNTWQSPYNMKCKEAISTHIWISCKGSYARCVQTTFVDFKYENIDGKYVALGMFWGFPHQIETKVDRTFNRLYVVEKMFKSKAEALVDMEKFKIKADPNYSEILNDIFGDG